MPNKKSWYHWKGHTLHLQVYLQPRAHRDHIKGVEAGVLKVSLIAPAVEGKANNALVKFLGEAFGVPQKNITILKHGLKTRLKPVTIENPKKIPEEITTQIQIPHSP